jgi:glutaconate CoA-transferase subunit A
VTLDRGKILSIEEAIARIPSGSSVAIGGATLRRKPMALVRALAASEAADLTIWTWIGSLDVDLLIACGTVREVNSAYVGFGALGLAPTARRASDSGDVAFRDWSESSLVASFRAGGQRLPFTITRALTGTSIADEIGREIRSPFDDTVAHAVPAAHVDVALLHAQAADPSGNVSRRQPKLSDDVDHVIAAAARSVIVSVEQLQSDDATREHRDETVIPGHLVSAACLAENGAHPTGCDGFYDPDLPHLRSYVEASKDPAGLDAYLDKYVRSVPHALYLQRVAERDDSL